jgi:serine/threonine protein kinase
MIRGANPEAQNSFTPRPFGRYHLVDKLAIGGMAEVFRAFFLGIKGFEMPLVIKRILPHLSANEAFVNMFITEAKIYVALRHHNIVQIYDFAKFQEHYFIALEYVAGRDLKNLLERIRERNILLSVDLTLFIGHEICKGLEYAHAQTDQYGNSLGLVHRDLSPANILLSYQGEVKVADFGIAKAKMKADITKAGVLKGKYEYMSPEQARGEPQIDSRSDIFSVGILLYEMLTGERLFKTESDTETIEKVKLVAIEEPIKKNSRISPRLNQIVMRALHPSPEARFQTAKDLQTALLECLQPISLDHCVQLLATEVSTLFKRERAEENLAAEKNKQILLKELESLKGLEVIDLEDDTTISSRNNIVFYISIVLNFILVGVLLYQQGKLSN